MKPLALIIENDDSYRMFLRFQMKGCGFDVLEATNGHAGVSMASLHTPTVIVSDFAMTNMSGGDVWHSLQKDTQLRRIPFVILSALIDGHWGHHQHIDLFALEAESHREGSKLRLLAKGSPTITLPLLLHDLLGFLPNDAPIRNANLPDALRNGTARFEYAHRALAYI